MSYEVAEKHEIGGDIFKAGADRRRFGTRVANEIDDITEMAESRSEVIYDRLAEIAREDLKNHKQVLIEFRLKIRKWIDKNNAEKYAT